MIYHSLFYCNRVCFHNGEHIRPLRRTEGSTADTPTEGERHTLCYFPILHRRKRQQPPRPPECLHQRKQQSHGDACLEHIRTSLSLLGTGRAGHQHLLAQLLPGGNDFWFGFFNEALGILYKSSRPFHNVEQDRYYCRRSKQLHKSPFKAPWIIDFLQLPLYPWQSLLFLFNPSQFPFFPILKTHFHLPMHMTAGWGKVISHLPGY